MLTKFLYRLFWAVLILNAAALILIPKIIGMGLEYLPSGADSKLSYLLGVGFFETSGLCTAFIIWQAKGVLKNLTLGRAFVTENAVYMRRASWAFLVIAGAAFVRMLFHIGRYKTWTGVLFEYNTLFIPVFIVAGLLCLVVASLFHSAATLKQDNDLVI